MSDVPETLEALQARHRKEQRDLVSRITQKKKQASKKTRKGVNDECDQLERDQKERHAREIATHNGEDPDEEPEFLEAEQEVEERSAEHVQPAANAADTPSAASTTPDQASTGQNGQKKKPNRAKARLARRAAEHDALVAQAKEEAANMPDLREQERTRMEQHFEKHAVEVKEIRADGHCLYAAVADQMETRGLGLKPRIQVKAQDHVQLPDYKRVRYAAADLIESKPDEFVGFMEEPIDTYLHKIRETGEWGGHMELMALAKSYGVKINVLHSDGRVDKIEPGEDVKDEDANEIWLGYYRHSHGLGEHYNSLRKVS